ncbi:hypothetical protein FQR65_LT13669 [Abscondita terminalis]|nr:hypothetical protein FQR65_LT13669 [Abscondita terminalis]
MNQPNNIQPPQIATSVQIHPPPVDKTELQLLLKAIPEYQPGYNLSIFITEVDNLLEHLKGRLSNDLIYVVEYTVRSKLTGEATDFIAYQNVRDWLNIKTFLITITYTENEIIADNCSDLNQFLYQVKSHYKAKIFQLIKQSRFNPHPNMNQLTQPPQVATSVQIYPPPVDKTELQLVLKAIPE